LCLPNVVESTPFFSDQKDDWVVLQGADVKYIDPSYIIRTVPTISNDRIYCKILAHNAVHAAFAGYTGITVVCFLELALISGTSTFCTPIRLPCDVYSNSAMMGHDHVH